MAEQSLCFLQGRILTLNLKQDQLKQQVLELPTLFQQLKQSVIIDLIQLNSNRRKKFQVILEQRFQLKVDRGSGHFDPPLAPAELAPGEKISGKKPESGIQACPDFQFGCAHAAGGRRSQMIRQQVTEKGPFRPWLSGKASLQVGLLPGPAAALNAQRITTAGKIDKGIHHDS